MFFSQYNIKSLNSEMQYIKNVFAGHIFKFPKYICESMHIYDMIYLFKNISMDKQFDKL